MAQFVPNRYTLLLEDPPVVSRFESRAQMQSAAAVQYRGQIEARQQAVLGQLAARNIRVSGRVSMLLNAIFVNAPANRISEMLAIPGVAAVRPMRRFKPLLNRATQLMNAPAAWTALGGQGNAGKGMKIAILDTGVDQTHPAFQDSSLQPPTGFPICSGFPGKCSDFTNSKVIVARSYIRQLAGFTSKDPKNLPGDTSVQPDPKVSQPDDYTPRDHVGHGTATASAAAANQNTGTVTFTGMAPKAFLGNYKIFGSPGVLLEQSPTDAVMIQAIEDALSDGMDVASISAGFPALAGATDTGAVCGLPAGQPCDPVAFAFENAAKAGLVIVASAGNSGSDALLAGGSYPYFNSISSPSSAPSVISVGATLNSHGLAPSVSVNTAGAPANVKSLAARQGDSFFFPSIQGANSASLIDITQLGNDGLACAALPGGSLNGAYALIERGTCNFSQKATNAQQAGALGIVFYMADSTPIFSPGGLGNAGFVGPSVMISNSDGLALKSYIDANPNSSVTIDVAGTEMDLATVNTAFGVTPPIAQNQLASYSSFGPTPDGAIKPDLVATGGLDSPNGVSPAGMYIAAQNFDPNGEVYSQNRYATFDGTSFAAPLVAGAAAMVKQMHPKYTVAQIKSALVNSAAQDTTTDDGYTDPNTGVHQSPQSVNVQWLGAGRLDAGAAVNATLTVVPATLSFGYLKSGSLPIKKALAITNNGAASVTISVTVPAGPAGTTLSTDQSSITVAAGATATLNVTLSGSVPAPGSYSGSVTLSAGGVTTHVPYLLLVPDGVPHNIVPFTSGLQGTTGQDAGSIAVQVIDQYGVPVSGVPVAYSVSPKGSVTFQSVSGEPACSPNNSSAATCATDNYGVAYAEVILGSTVGSPTITATANNVPSSFTAFILPPPVITQGQILDNAAFQPIVAPGSIAAIKGTNLMDPDLLINAAQGYDLIPPAFTYFPLTLDGVNVSFDVPGTGISVAAPVVAVSPGQIDVQIPWELKGQTSAQVKVIVDEELGPPAILGAPVTAQLADYTPAFFSNSNIAAALDGNYKPINSSNPAVRGQTISLYANGLGPVANPPADGFGAVGIGSTTTTPCVVTLGGQQLTAAQVPFCGLAPGLAIYQINVQVPSSLSPGNQPITITIGGQTSPSGIVIPVQ